MLDSCRYFSASGAYLQHYAGAHIPVGHTRNSLSAQATGILGALMKHYVVHTYTDTNTISNQLQGFPAFELCSCGVPVILDVTYIGHTAYIRRTSFAAVRVQV